MSEPYEPTLSEQLFDLAVALNQVIARHNAVLDALGANANVLTSALETRGYAITGGSDDDGQIQPVNIEAEDINLSASNQTRIERGIFPFLRTDELLDSATLDESHNGLFLWYAGSSAAEILPWDTTAGGEITYEDDGEGNLVPVGGGEPSNPPVGYWVALRCAPGAANANVKCPIGHEIDQDTSDIPLITDDVRATLVIVYVGGNQWRTL